MERMKQKRITKIPKTKFDDATGEKLREHFGTDAFNANLRSSHGPLVEMALAGPPTGGAKRAADAHVTDTSLFHQGRHRQIHAVLRTLSTAHQVALWLAYGPERYTLEVYARFPTLGACAGVVLVSGKAREAFDAEWYARAAKGHDEAKLDAFVRRGLGEWLRSAPKAVVESVVSDAAQLLTEARQAYILASKDAADERRVVQARRLAKEREAPLELQRRTALL